MAKRKNDDNKKVVYRRINGRVVPIAVGTGVAASAANTTRVYQKGNITIDKKKYSFAPVTKTFGSKYDLKVAGKKAATATIGIDKDKTASFGWLGTKKKFQSRGYASLLSKESIRDARRRGAKEVWNQTIHRRSALTNYDKKRDSFWRVSQRAKKDGGVNFFRTTKANALSKIADAQWSHNEIAKDIAREARISLPHFKGKKVKRKAGFKPVFKPSSKLARGLAKKVKAVGDYHLYKMAKADSPIWRHTDLKGMPKTTKYSKPFRTVKNKVTIGAGIALAGVGALYGGKNGKKKK
jgi:hypothetical protein